jgi:hypothetical protein
MSSVLNDNVMEEQCACRLCGSSSDLLFVAEVLAKYKVRYFKCSECALIQTEEPYWLDEAYNSAISLLDVGLLSRNYGLVQPIASILKLIPDKNNHYLDYGGGYGVFTRLMRDAGYDFYLFDKYSENLFCKHFELKDCSTTEKFAAVTAFELFEHLPNPFSQVKELFEFSDVVIFSTELQPDDNLLRPEDWWYFVPISGQHVAFYSIRTLKKVADLIGCSLYTNGSNLHVLSKRSLISDPFCKVKPESVVEKLLKRIVRGNAGAHKEQRRESLTTKDFEYYKALLSRKNV